MKGGSYHVTVTGTDIHGMTCLDSKSLDVSVYDPTPRPAYEQAWFWFITAIVVVILIAVAWEYRRERRRGRRDNTLDEERLLDAKQK